MAEYHLPENAEASIIGCLLLCPDTKPAVSRLVNEGDFSPGLNASLFAAALELEEPDSAAFHAAVKRRGYILPDGFFRELGDIAISRSNVELYCSLLRDKAQKRKRRRSFPGPFPGLERSSGGRWRQTSRLHLTPGKRSSSTGKGSWTAKEWCPQASSRWTVCWGRVCFGPACTCSRPALAWVRLHSPCRLRTA